jgi:hypothetical protein
MVTLVIAGLGAWFVAALGIGVLLGKLISAHEESRRWAVEPARRSVDRAA